MHIIHIISSLKRGGAEQLLANLLQAWPHDQHTVIFFHDGPVRNQIELYTVKCIQVQAWGGFINPLFFYRLYTLIKSIKPDRIITHLWAANLLGRISARILNIPCICVLHAVANYQGRLRNSIDRIIPCYPTHTVAVSSLVEHSFVKKKLYNNLQTICNGIDPDKVAQHALQAATYIKPSVADIEKKSFIIGAVGRFIPEKNFATLIRAYAQLLPEYSDNYVHLIIIGTGPEEHRLRTLVEHLQIKDSVTFIINQAAYGYYPYFSCFVQPSQYEGLSLALLEAIACKKPVIVTADQGQHPVIVHEKHGLVINSNNKILTKSLVTALKKLINDPEQALQYVQNNFYQLEQKFHIKQTVAAYKRLLMTNK